MSRLFARSLLLRLIALCTAFGVLYAPVAEAAECSGELKVASVVEQHDEPAGDETVPEKHGTCAHGHCHHASQALGRSEEFPMLLTPSGLLAGTTERSLNGSVFELATPPPRA